MPLQIKVNSTGEIKDVVIYVTSPAKVFAGDAVIFTPGLDCSWYDQEKEEMRSALEFLKQRFQEVSIEKDKSIEELKGLIDSLTKNRDS